MSDEAPAARPRAAPFFMSDAAPATSAEDSPFVRVRDLRKDYAVRRGLFGRARTLHAVAGVSFDVPRGGTFGLVGESGSGKSTIARLLMRAEAPTAGTIAVDGRDIAHLGRAERDRFHRQVQPVLQDPYGALDPRMRVGRIVDEPLRIHRTLDARARTARVDELLQLVGLPADAARRYPHELSGGQRQRVAIARALGLQPPCVILDEPVSALDVSIQAQIILLLKTLQQTLGLAYLLISHDLAVVASMSDRIGVLYLGEFMEVAATEDIVRNPRHPYTRALIASVDARSGLASAGLDGDSASPVRGEIPSPLEPPTGCPFHPRCPRAEARCASEKPLLRALSATHRVACHFAESLPPAGLVRAPLAPAPLSQEPA